ncbi:MAG: isoprenylcysteine carboxylmethyltransferase family protein [Thermoguttaceae bacterium]
MSQELSRFGVGPKILLTAAAYAVIAGAVTWLWPEACRISAIPHWLSLALGIALIAIGVPMLLLAVRTGMAAYNCDKLATTGLFGIVRNPMYAAWIVFIIPGVVLLTRSWPLFLTPLVAYLMFKLLIRRENEYLEKRFGEAYRRYRAEVNELCPLPRIRGRSA